jgi:hypothetical protein
VAVKGNWLLIVLLVAGAFALARIYFSLRKMRDMAKSDSWDEKTIERLRRSGGIDSFKPHDVDFFLALPTDSAGNAVMAQLERDGFAVHVRVVPESGDLPVSLRATRSMRLSLPEVKEMSARFAALAKAHLGRYDGWNVSASRSDA